MPTREDLKILQSQDLELKVMLTKQRIREWVTYYGEIGVYVSFSGGKDSTVLLHIVRELYPDIEAVFVNTGLEYPEIQRFVKTFDIVKILYPPQTFADIIKKYGYPVISKNVSHNVHTARFNPEGNVKKKIFDPNKKGQYAMFKWSPLLDVDFLIDNHCCLYNKKKPMALYEKETGKVPIIATMATESVMRRDAWLQKGCNAFDGSHIYSAPMSFWTEQDVLQYIYENNIEIASVYGGVTCDDGQLPFIDCECKLCTTGEHRTGCIFCGYGAHLEKGETRFQRLKRTHPKQYDFCINGGEYDTDGLWKPNEKGLGMGHVFDVINSIYGNDFIRYQ